MSLCVYRIKIGKLTLRLYIKYHISLYTTVQPMKIKQF